ncbi:MAG: ABC transporter substrate-binding protein [Chloroflexota bacterium]
MPYQQQSCDLPAVSSPQSRRAILRGAGQGVAALAIGAATSLGASLPPVVQAAGSVTVGYLKDGLTCEGSLFAAQAQDYFRDEGLDLKTVAGASPAALATGMMQGTVDAMQDPAWALAPPLLPKGMNVGDMVATAGIQRGSMTIVVAADSPIHSLVDLRGQTVAAADRWRFMFSMPISAAGLNATKDITWQPGLPAGQVGQAIKDGKVAAATVHQPYASAIESSGIGRILVMQTTPPQQDDYCCSVILPGKLVNADCQKAAAITRALMRGSAWMRAHPSEGAQLEVDVKQVTLALADNQRAITHIDFFPSIQAASNNTLDLIKAFKRLGFLDPATSETTLLNQIFVPVTDEPAMPSTGGGGAIPADHFRISEHPWLVGGGAALLLLGAALRRRACASSPDGQAR